MNMASGPDCGRESLLPAQSFWHNAPPGCAGFGTATRAHTARGAQALLGLTERCSLPSPPLPLPFLPLLSPPLPSPRAVLDAARHHVGGNTCCQVRTGFDMPGRYSDLARYCTENLVDEAFLVWGRHFEPKPGGSLISPRPAGSAAK